MPEVTEIGDDTFLGADNLVEVSMPEVTSIGESAFRHADNLVEVSMPKATDFGTQPFLFTPANMMFVAAPEACDKLNKLVCGCTDENNSLYNSNANTDDGSCFPIRKDFNNGIISAKEAYNRADCACQTSQDCTAYQDAFASTCV